MEDGKIVWPKMKDDDGMEKENPVKLNYLFWWCSKNHSLWTKRKLKNPTKRKRKREFDAQVTSITRDVVFVNDEYASIFYVAILIIIRTLCNKKSARIRKWDFHPCSNVSSTHPCFSMFGMLHRWAGELFKSFCLNFCVCKITIEKSITGILPGTKRDDGTKRERWNDWWHC